MSKDLSFFVSLICRWMKKQIVVDVQMGGTSRYVDSLQEKKTRKRIDTKKNDRKKWTETEFSLVRPLLSSRH